MQLTGLFSELPWAKVLNFLASSQVIGAISIQTDSYQSLRNLLRTHLWVEQGYLVGAATDTNGRGLLQLMQQQDWLSLPCGERLIRTLPQGTALGTYLKAQGVLSDRQLHILFHQQVIHPLNQIRHLQQASFHFETLDELPQLEQTGLRVLIDEIQVAKWHRVA